MTVRDCLTCGASTTHGSRCPRCAPSARGGINTARHQRLRARVIAEETHCHLCGDLVDRQLPGTHPMGPTAHHVIPRSRGGPMLRGNYRLAHKRCNEKAGAPDG